MQSPLARMQSYAQFKFTPRSINAEVSGGVKIFPDVIATLIGEYAREHEQAMSPLKFDHLGALANPDTQKAIIAALISENCESRVLQAIFDNLGAHPTRSPNDYATAFMLMCLEIATARRSIQLHGIVLDGFEFNNINLTNLVARGVVFKNVVFNHCLLSGAIVDGSLFENVRFNQVAMREFSAIATKFDNVSFEQCEVYGARVDESQFSAEYLQFKDHSGERMCSLTLASLTSHAWSQCEPYTLAVPPGKICSIM